MSIILESDYIGTKFYYEMPFISSSELCSRIKALYRKTLYLNNPFYNIHVYIDSFRAKSDLSSFERFFCLYKDPSKSNSLIH